MTSEDLNKSYKGSGFKLNFLEAERALLAIGCEVKRARRVHNKMLAVDDELLVEGSFNWLSSVRSENKAYQYREVSVIYKGDGVAEYIKKEKKLHGIL